MYFIDPYNEWGDEKTRSPTPWSTQLSTPKNHVLNVHMHPYLF